MLGNSFALNAVRLFAFFDGLSQFINFFEDKVLFLFNFLDVDEFFDLSGIGSGDRRGLFDLALSAPALALFALFSFALFAAFLGRVLIALAAADAGRR